MEFDINTIFASDVFCKHMLVSEKNNRWPCLVGGYLPRLVYLEISRYYWAAACHGEEGIIRLVEQLNAELRLTMAQLGVAQVKDLTIRLDAGKVVIGWGGCFG